MKRQTHSYKKIYEVYILRGKGLIYAQIAKVTGIPISTVGEMIRGVKSYEKFHKIFLEELEKISEHG